MKLKLQLYENEINLKGEQRKQSKEFDLEYKSWKLFIVVTAVSSKQLVVAFFGVVSG